MDTAGWVAMAWWIIGIGHIHLLYGFRELADESD